MQQATKGKTRNTVGRTFKKSEKSRWCTRKRGEMNDPIYTLRAACYIPKRVTARTPRLQAIADACRHRSAMRQSDRRIRNAAIDQA